MKTSVVVIISFFFLVQGRPDIPEEDLLDELFYSYNKYARPATRDSPTIYVSHGLTLTRIVSIGNGVVSIDAWQNLKWTDLRLTWDPSDYFSTTSLSLVVNNVWRPDILLYDVAGPNDGYIYKDVNVIVHSTGTVTWVPVVRLTTYCDDKAIDANGTFTCKWKFGSWTLDESKLNISNSVKNSSSNAPDIDMSNYIQNKKYSIVKTEAVVNEKFYGCCPEPYQDLTYYITFESKADAPAQETETDTQTDDQENEKSSETGKAGTETTNSTGT